MPRISGFTLCVTLALAVAIPTITPRIGNFSMLQRATSGPSIYYTTNGSTPTRTRPMSLTSSVTAEAKAFKSGSNPGSGANTSLFAGVRMGKGVTRYADGQLSSNCTSGNYSIANRNCTGSDGDAYRSLQAASNASWAGDTILIRAFSGRYTGSGDGSLIRPKAGNAGSYLTTYTTYTGYQSERPVIKGFDAEDGSRYIYYKNLILDGQNNANSYGFFGLHYSRAENIEIKNQGYHGMLWVDRSELINLNVHNNGFNNAQCTPGTGAGHVGQCHGLYTGDGQNNLVDGGEWHHNEGYGIHCYTKCANTIIRNLRTHHNRFTGVLMVDGSGIGNSRIYNVVSDNNGTFGPDKGSGISIAVSGIVAYNITTYNNSGGGVVSFSQSNHTLRNCLCLDGAYARHINGQRNDGGFSGGFSNNITSGSASTYFVDPANGNFQHRPASKVKGVGADLSSPKN